MDLPDSSIGLVGPVRVELMEVDCIVKPHYNEDALDMKISLYLIFTIIYSLHVDIGEKHVIFVVSCLLYIRFSTWNKVISP